MPGPTQSMIDEGFFQFKKKPGPGMCWVRFCRNKARPGKSLCPKCRQRHWRHRQKYSSAYATLRDHAR